MWRWRIGIGLALFLIVGIPALSPVLEIVRYPPTGWKSQDFERLAILFTNTFLLVAGVVAASLPLGTILAILLFRTDLPFRRLFVILVALAIFIPLPVITSVWHTLFGGQSGLPFAFWQPRPGQPWPQGLAPAIWVHVMAALPWVTLIVGMGLRWVERELEEDALQVAGPLTVLLRITLVRCRGSLILAALWVGVQTAGEIAVTDMFLLRTYAEEVYLLFSEGQNNAASKAMILFLPIVALFWLAVIWIGPRIMNSVPPLEILIAPSRQFSLRKFKWPAFGMVLLTVLTITGIPALSMIWQTGYQNERTGWSLAYFADGMNVALRVSSDTVIASILGAALVGFLTTVLAWLVCWCVTSGERGCVSAPSTTRGERGRVSAPSVTTSSNHQERWQIALLCLVALLWLTPGPIAGIGQQSFILSLAQLDFPWINAVLYNQPSYVPSWWAWLICSFPFSVVLILPIMRLIPRELQDAVKLDGASRFQEMTRLYLPLTLPASLAASLAATALSLNEISASKHVATAGIQTFTQALFERMHSGVTQDVSSLCLLLLIILFLTGLELESRFVVLSRKNN